MNGIPAKAHLGRTIYEVLGEFAAESGTAVPTCPGHGESGAECPCHRQLADAIGAGTLG